MRDDPIGEAQGVRFGLGKEFTPVDYLAFTNRVVVPITWTTVEEDGYSPSDILKIIKDYRTLREQRANIVATNTRYMDENRELRRKLDAKG